MRAAFERARTADQRKRQGIAEARCADGDNRIGDWLDLCHLAISQTNHGGDSPHRSTAEIGTLEYDGCAERGCGRDDGLADVLGKRNAAGLERAMERHPLTYHKAHGCKPRACGAIGRLNAKARTE